MNNISESQPINSKLDCDKFYVTPDTVAPGSISTLFQTVVDGGYCIGCGACASIPGSPIKMKLDEYGRFCASLESSTEHHDKNLSILDVCPFSDTAANEDEIGQELFGQNCQHHSRIGYHLATYAGYVTENNFRQHGSSGGMGTWIVTELFNQKLIDAVIHVHEQKPSENDSKLFSFRISESVEQIRAGAKSRYYPVEMSEVLSIVRNRPGRYAIVGVPCFIKAVRLLAKKDQVIRDRIHFCVGLVCGHLKSTRFAEMFAWQCGIEPGKLQSIDFRKKISGQAANKYGVEVRGIQNDREVSISKSNHEFFGFLWGHGFFKYQACDYCDDVVAETADVTVGDAWLPNYVKDSEGTNVVVVRNPVIKHLIENGMKSGRLHLDSINADDVAKSQDAGLRHRREGLAYRLYLKDKAKQWRPHKRIKAEANHLNMRLKKIYKLRMLMASQSHIAFHQAIQMKSFDIFRKIIDPIVKSYDSLYKPPLWRRWLSLIKKYLKPYSGS
ncbi:Coenzyme F420 hydrogenase/dehydrogenase, beta subunit C-terminal domain [Calothrix anomala FACHB-343]|uniref:Coenzyme F420 hydrogenase/dehydrogenase, beta subunit C-terminal domain n=3 Tax=Calotrichaceae TaxID=2661849 RepID=A0ABR8AJJ8_9CYAN|nr:Coenzyme F420 hydrogenase/dehydrogenase, beta subunit C-terminal domain [Calothrix parietina FACHB-288]MBD2229175.1 Coenzyme F420 hydrogenase/dehydrogenase, beta subunit C-terminal domain [Calothrix anomala FACHB-343]